MHDARDPHLQLATALEAGSAMKNEDRDRGNRNRKRIFPNHPKYVKALLISKISKVFDITDIYQKLNWCVQPELMIFSASKCSSVAVVAVSVDHAELLLLAQQNTQNFTCLRNRTPLYDPVRRQ